MAKSRTKPSAFNELLKLIRRILVLSVAAFGLAREWPYEIVALRAVALWGVLYLSSIGIELIFQYLNHHAARSAIGQTSGSASPDKKREVRPA